MTESVYIGLIFIPVLAILLFSFLFLRGRMQMSLLENVVLHGMVVFALTLIASTGIFWGKFENQEKAKEPLFIIGDQSLMNDSDWVLSELDKAEIFTSPRLVLYRERDNLKINLSKKLGKYSSEKYFPSLDSAISWASLESSSVGQAMTIVISSRQLERTYPTNVPFFNIIVPEKAEESYLKPLRLPQRMIAGSGLNVSPEFTLLQEGEYILKLYDDDLLHGIRKISWVEDSIRQNLVFEFKADLPGTHVLRLDLEDSYGKLLDRIHAHLTVIERPRIHFVTPANSASPLFEFLREQEYELQRYESDWLPSDVGPGTGEIIILDNVAASSLTWRVVGQLYRMVSEKGTGLLVVGGDQSYTYGKYSKAPIERLLPVWMGLKDRNKEKHKTSMIIILDVSGSMLCPPEGCSGDTERMFGPRRSQRGPRIRKIDLAKQALLNLIPSMKDDDYFGILGGITPPYWELEPKLLKDVESLQGLVQNIRARGEGIFLYSAFLEVLKKIDNIEAEVKHVTVMIDTDDVDEIKVLGYGTVEDLIEQLNARNISVSFIGFGFSDDQYVPLLNRLATTTGGYLYLTSDISEIPTFLSADRDKLADRQVIRRHLETHFSKAEFPQILEMPPLEGQFITEAKPDAFLPVWSEIGYPILTYRRLGVGLVASLSTDGGGSLAPTWVEEGAGPIWDGIMARLSAQESGEEELFISRESRSLRIYFTRSLKGLSKNIGLLLKGKKELERFLPFEEIYPGIHRILLDYPERGSYRYEIKDKDHKILLKGSFSLDAETKETSNRNLIYKTLISRTQKPLPLTKGLLRLVIILALGLFVLYEILIKN